MLSLHYSRNFVSVISVLTNFHAMQMESRFITMKIIYISVFSLLFSVALHAQDTAQDTNLAINRVPVDTNSKKILVKDTGAKVENMYQRLLNDDPVYTKKTPWYVPAARVLLNNAGLLAIDRFIFNYDFSRIGFNSWARNIKEGWEWDDDRFGTNFFLHPYTGGNYVIAARSNGYTFWESFPYALEGSLLWEYFGETTRPSYNDVVNTTINGMFGGEVIYRLGSNILDDRTTGTERFFREFAAGILSPTRLLSRIIQGKTSNVTDHEVYQKEPLDIVLSAGVHKVNGDGGFGTGPMFLLLNADFDYGEPFEKRDRKPFDYFQLRTNLTIGGGRKIVDNIVGYGLLTGNNSKMGDVELLTGIFQHFDYWDNSNFELGTMAFGGGVISKMTVMKNTNLYTNINLGIIPLAGNSTEFGPDTVQTRDYNFGSGAEGKIDLTLNFKGIASVTLLGYYYWIHTLVGRLGDNFIGILKPRIEFHIFKDIGIGFEHLIYLEDRYPKNSPFIHTTKTEQKIFIALYLADF